MRHQHRPPSSRRRTRLLAAVTTSLAVAFATLSFATPAADADEADCNLFVEVARDFLGTGTYDPEIDVPQAGVRVTVTDRAGNTFSSVTSDNGTVKVNPVLAGLTGTRFMVTTAVTDQTDHDGVPYSSYLEPAPAGTGPERFASNPTFIDLSDGRDSTLRTAVWNPRDWAPENPEVATSMHSALPVPPLPLAVAKLNFNDRVINENTLLQDSLGTQGELGTIGGLAHQPSKERLFGAAMAKGQTPYGKGGPGAIYSIPKDPKQKPTLFTTVPDAGTTKHAATYPAADPDFMNAAGKESLGGIALSDDETELYVVNLNTRELVTYDATQPTAAAPKSRTPIPNQGCATAGDWRPFALEVHNGSIYIGGVCTAESKMGGLLLVPVLADQSARKHLQAVIVRFNGTGFDEVYRHGLGFPRGQTVSSLGTRPDVATHWNAWDSNAAHVPTQWSAAPALSRPQPLLSSIVWDRDGSMILGFRDRGGDQMAASPGIYTSAGDINKVCRLGDGSFAWEGETGCADNSSLIWGGPQVPAVPELKMPKEFFVGDWFAATHMETAQGGLIYPLQQKKIASTNMDPNMLLSSGIGWYSSETGRGPGTDPVGSGLLLSTVATNGIGKANALGDIELLARNAGQQIGSRVWHDVDGDGIQDADEPGIRGVEVSLFDDTGVQRATRTTNRDGEYYFGDAGSDLVAPGRTYGVRFNACGADTSGIPGAPDGSVLTFSPSGATNGARDSDVTVLNGCTGDALVETSSSPGAVHHGVDAGVVSP